MCAIVYCVVDVVQIFGFSAGDFGGKDKDSEISVSQSEDHKHRRFSTVIHK